MRISTANGELVIQDPQNKVTIKKEIITMPFIIWQYLKFIWEYNL